MIDPVVDLVTELVQRVINAESGDVVKIKDREPYPPDGPIEILPPVDDPKTIQKRKAVDREFWETL